MRKSLHKLIVLLTVLSLLLCTGCGQKSDGKNTDGKSRVKLSCSKGAFMHLSKEEKEYLDALQTIASECRFQFSDSSGVMTVKNTTSRDVDVNLHVMLLDSDGDIAKEYSFYVGDLARGETASLPGFGGPNVAWEKIQVVAEGRYEESFYVTKPVSIGADAVLGARGMKISFAGSLPYSFDNNSAWGKSNEYSLRQFEYDPIADPGYVHLYIRKETGGRNTSDSIYYRIVDEDGVIWDRGSIYITVSEDETFCERCYIDVPDGNYYFEFFE